MDASLDDVQWAVAEPPRRATSVRQAAWRIRLRGMTRSPYPSQRLWAAVLYDAIAALRGKPRTLRIEYRVRTSRETLWQEASAWLMARDGEPLGTFESICAVLGLDTEAVRRDLCDVAANTGLKLRVPPRRAR